LVPRQRVVHTLKRELLRLGRPDALVGTRFVSLREAAEEVLRSAGVTFAPGEERLRPARLLGLLRGGLSTPSLPASLVAHSPGWDEAIVRTVADLEAAGLRAKDLDAAGKQGSAQIAGVARFWQRLDAAAGPSWTRGRILLEAAAALEQGASWPFSGGSLVALPPEVSAVEARLVRAIPGARVALLGARPVRARYLNRIGRLLGPEARAAIGASSAPRSGESERDVLASYLFEPPAVLADPDRPRPGADVADGTVELEEYAGVDAELEAAARWVGERILNRVPLERIAVLVPALDPLAELLTARLRRLPWPGGDGLPVHVAGGLPLRSTASGARTMAVLRALAEHLGAEWVAQVLPVLELEGPDRHLSLGAAAELVSALGAVGGDPANPAGALDWSDTAAGRERDLTSQIAAAGGEDHDRATRRHRRLLEDVAAVRPALDALVRVARLVVEAAPLAAVWHELRAFLDRWVRHPGGGPRAHHLIDERLAPLLGDASLTGLTGADALRVIARAADAVRVDDVPFGEPAVYVGTIREAVGLRFSAVRAIGLCEGQFPSAAREDPVLPDLLREVLEGSVATATDRVLRDLFALDRVVRDTEETVVLSAPRTDLDSSQRGASSVLLEAAGALGRDRDNVVPDLDGLDHGYFEPARERLLSRPPMPLSEAAWQDAVASGAIGLPPGWSADVLRSPGPLPLPDETPAPGPLWGLLDAEDVEVPGLSADRPLSPSSLRTLLECPYRFLLERVLGLQEPASLASCREIDPLSYGTLLHSVAESLYGDHGEDLAAGRGSIAEWRARAGRLADEAFASFVRWYPLAGAAVRRQERQRSRRDVSRLLDFDWERAGRWRLIGVERTFGFAQPIALPAGGRSLYLRGRIDRVETEGGVTVVRDLKTGKRKGEEDPEPTIDAQIAVYAMVARKLAADWGVPMRVAASYTHVGPQGVAERRFEGEGADALLSAAEGWLAVAAELLERRAFPRTSRGQDCTYCPFPIVCGEDAYARAQRLLAIEPRLDGFKNLKSPIEEDEE